MSIEKGFITRYLFVQSVLILSTLICPWWITALLLATVIFFFRRPFYEAFIYALFFDIIGGGTLNVLGISFVWSISTTIFFLFALYGKDYFRVTYRL